VPLQPCSACRVRPTEKLSQVTWAWNPRPLERLAYRQKLCLACFVQRFTAYDKPIAPTGALTCPGCGIETEHDMEPVYATAFIPGVGKHTLEMPLCGACAVNVRVAAQENAELLPERAAPGSGAWSQAPDTAPQLSAWERLGILPRE
jgi:hypothetical protein